MKESWDQKIYVKIMENTYASYNKAKTTEIEPIIKTS